MSQGIIQTEKESIDPKSLLTTVTRVLESCAATAALAEPYREKLEECKRDRLRIGVIGITSSGKSTFLNALIGTKNQLLPEQSKATTNLLVYCRHGPLCIKVCFEDGKKTQDFSGLDVSPELMRSFCAEDQNPRNKKRVYAIFLWTPKMRLDAKFEIVDTPGLDAFGLDHHEELTLRRFLPEADIVIYMTEVDPSVKTNFELF